MKKALFTILFLVSVSLVSAQDPSAPKVTIYKPFTSTETVEKKQAPTELYCAKWNYYLLGRGIFSFDLERMLTKKISVQAGLGVTYRDLMFEAFNSEKLPTDYFDNEAKYSFGPMVDVRLRFYPRDGDLEGLYISPLLRYRKYNIKSIPEPFTGEKEQDLSYKMTEFGLVLGYQFESWLWDATSDVYMGAGISNQKFRNYEEINANGDMDWVNKSRQVPYLFVGAEIGIPF